jgi:hypothetical protein
VRYPAGWEGSGPRYQEGWEGRGPRYQEGWEGSGPRYQEGWEGRRSAVPERLKNCFKIYTALYTRLKIGTVLDMDCEYLIT